jgi:hypothetical protein
MEATNKMRTEVSFSPLKKKNEMELKWNCSGFMRKG